MRKALVLLSGGLDSAAALWWAKKRYEVYALTFRYGRLNKREMRAARKLARIAGVKKHFVIDVNFLKEVSEVDWMKERLSLKKTKMPSIYIPSRNTIFFGIASHISEIFGINSIITGHSFLDPFPDSKPDYVKSMNDAVNYGSWLGRRFRTKIVMPIYRMNKTEVLKFALREKIPLESTWSCYKETKYACGECNGCKNRLQAFGELGIDDRIKYQN